jgi:hypothetical protein
LHKSKTNDQNEKDIEIQGGIEVWQGQNRIKLKVQGQLEM